MTRDFDCWRFVVNGELCSVCAETLETALIIKAELEAAGCSVEVLASSIRK